MDTNAFRFIQSIQFYLEKQQIILNGKRVLAAVSGGVDSCVLLDALVKLSVKLNFDVGVCHVNHGLRGNESNQDEKFVIQRTKEYNIQLTVRRFEADDIKKIQTGNLEQEARKQRYKLLTHTAEELGYGYIATGHSKSDQAETVLHRLFRSSGLSGLAGILPVCEMHEQTVIRPLLCYTRNDILEYAKIMALEYRHDEMNDDTEFTRVKIRKTLLPTLKYEYNPNIEESLSRLASICRDEGAFWKQHTKRIREEAGDGTTDSPIDRTLFISLSVAEQRRYLHSWFGYLGVEPNWTQIEDSLLLINGNTPQGELHLTEQISLYRRYDQFFVSETQKEPIEIEQKELNIPGTTVVSDLKIKIEAEVFPKSVIKMEKNKKNTARFDLDTLDGDIYIRTWLDGDRIQPVGMAGNKKLSSLFQEHRINLEKRHTTPLICHKNDIIWVPGCSASGKYMVCSTTQSVLELTIHSIHSKTSGNE